LHCGIASAGSQGWSRFIELVLMKMAEHDR
jgi:hypothetical protein